MDHVTYVTLVIVSWIAMNIDCAPLKTRSNQLPGLKQAQELLKDKLLKTADTFDHVTDQKSSAHFNELPVSGNGRLDSDTGFGSFIDPEPIHHEVPNEDNTNDLNSEEFGGFSNGFGDIWQLPESEGTWGDGDGVEENDGSFGNEQTGFGDLYNVDNQESSDWFQDFTNPHSATGFSDPLSFHDENAIDTKSDQELDSSFSQFGDVNTNNLNKGELKHSLKDLSELLQGDDPTVGSWGDAHDEKPTKGDDKTGLKSSTKSPWGTIPFTFSGVSKTGPKHTDKPDGQWGKPFDPLSLGGVIDKGTIVTSGGDTTNSLPDGSWGSFGNDGFGKK